MRAIYQIFIYEIYVVYIQIYWKTIFETLIH